MTELIEGHMESMTLEIEEMRRLKLFTIAETRTILTRRKVFEYRINGVNKSLQDLMGYIDFEQLVLHDIKKRRNKMRIIDKKSSIEFRILKRIKSLFDIAVLRYNDNFSLYISYFQFCKDYNYHQAATLLVQKIMKAFPHLPEAWQVATAWFMNRDIDQSLQVIQKALDIHKNFEQFYTEAVQLEILRKDKKTREDSNTKEENDALCTKRIAIYVKAMLKNIKTPACKCKMLKILKQYNSMQECQDMIMKNLLEEHCDDEIMWNLLAQQELNLNDDEEGSDSKTLKFDMIKCFDKYEEGLRCICDAKKPYLWILYLNFLLELKQEQKTWLFNLGDLVVQRLLMVFDRAATQIHLEDEYYIEWAKLYEDETSIIRIIDRGLKAQPNSIQLWLIRLKYPTIKEDTDQFNKLFKKAVLQLKEKGLPIWTLAIRYHSITSPDNVLDLIYQDAISQPEKISSVMKSEYIEWLSLTKSMFEVRKAYNSIATIKPYSKELHKTMARVEELDGTEDVLILENILKFANEQFGHEDIDVRIDLMKFYLKNNAQLQQKKPSFDVNEEVQRLIKEGEEFYKNNSFLSNGFKVRCDDLYSSV